MSPDFLQSGDGGEFACGWHAGLEGTDALAGDCLGPRHYWCNSPVVGMPDWRGLMHWRGIVWDPGIIGVTRRRLCCDCLCLIALFRDVLLFVRDQTDSSTRCLQDISVWRTMRWELGSFGRDDPSCAAVLSCCLDVWQIKGRVTIIKPRWANDILSLMCVSVCGTAVSVIEPVTAQILVIGPSDRVGGSVGRSEWLLLVSRGHGYGVIRLVHSGPLSSAPVLSGSGIKGVRWSRALHLTPHQ